jgi:FKBP-type peptidyl-prolyl cis-trans isomerase FkpA
MTLRAAATIILVLMGLTVLAMRVVPELFYRPPTAEAADAGPSAGLTEPELPAGIAEAMPVDAGQAPATTTVPPGAPMSPDQLQVQDLEPGTGSAVAAGQKAVVHYTGWLWDAAAPENKGRKFDSSRDHGDTFSFRVGGGEVIRGWDQGVEGMKVGGKRRLVIPPELGYGARGAGGAIPGGATLVFDVELMGIR